MRWLPVAALLLLTACQPWGDTIINVANDADSGSRTGDDNAEGGAASVITGFSCQRAACTGSHCSSVICSWQGPAAVLCARGNSDGLPDQCTAGPVASPAGLDPGPPGAGGGTWQMSLDDSGIVAGPVPVVLDS